MASQSGPGTAQPHHGRHQPLPLPGRSHPGPLAGRRITHHGTPTWDLRRARCGESRPAGSGSGPRKRRGRKTGTAPRTDFTTPTAHTDPCTSAHPQPTPRRVPGRASACSDGNGSAASSTNTCRMHEVTQFSAPTGLWLGSGLLAFVRDLAVQAAVVQQGAGLVRVVARVQVHRDVVGEWTEVIEVVQGRAQQCGGRVGWLRRVLGPAGCRSRRPGPSV